MKLSQFTTSFNARYAGENPTTPLYSWTPYLLAGTDAIEFHHYFSIWNKPVIAEMLAWDM